VPARDGASHARPPAPLGELRPRYDLPLARREAWRDKLETLTGDRRAESGERDLAKSTVTRTFVGR